MMDAKGVRNMFSVLVVVNKHNTARVASCWFIIYYRVMYENTNIKLDFSLKIGYTGSLNLKKISTNGCFGLHIYLRTNETSIHNSLYVFDNWRKNLSCKKDIVQLQ